MPESANEHLDAIERIVRAAAPRVIVDVGMGRGRGNYGWFLRKRSDIPANSSVSRYGPRTSRGPTR